MPTATKLQASPGLPHLTIFFEGFGHGWRENYYSTQPMTDPALITAASQLITARKNMLAVGYTITAYMASDDRVKRDSVLGGPLGTGGGGDYFPFGGYNKQLGPYAP